MTKKPVTAEIPDKLAGYLRKGCPAILITTDADGYPHTAFTWVAAAGRMQLRCGVDHGGTTMGNLLDRGRAALQVVGPEDLIFLIKGPAVLIKDRIEATEIPMAMFELEAREVRDQTWPPVSVTPLGYLWPKELEPKMKQMEKAVFHELAHWNEV